ncbi:MAG TPA: hypothetical protein VHJ39_00325 [Solirubrobacteraceae bacterium]|nr:hypothetical protein [Solirubrobacteraceae bacterium]
MWPTFADAGWRKLVAGLGGCGWIRRPPRAGGTTDGPCSSPLQLTANHKVATPVNWKKGDDVIIAGSVSDDEARERYPEGWDAPRPYIRIVPEPV